MQRIQPSLMQMQTAFDHFNEHRNTLKMTTVKIFLNALYLKIQISSFLQPSNLEALILDYLFMRIRKLGHDLRLRRDKQTDKTNQIEGRVYLGSESFHSDLDMTGLIERARFGSIPLRAYAKSPLLL